jgi:hypothetical protein
MSAETFIMVDGTQLPANLQPPFPSLQSAFRNSSGRITIDLVAARNVARDIIRRERTPLFEKNDVAALNAALRKDDAAVTATLDRGDALRDATRDPRLETANTPQDILDTTDLIVSDLKKLF